MPFDTYIAHYMASWLMLVVFTFLLGVYYILRLYVYLGNLSTDVVYTFAMSY